MPEIHRNTPNHNNPPSPFTQPVGAVREPPLPPPNPPPSTNPLHHRNTTYPTTTVPPGEPHVIPADAGIQRKTKHATNRPLSRSGGD